MLALNSSANDSCPVEAVYSTSPVFWGGILLLFVLILYRKGWNFWESILEIVGLHVIQDVTAV
jgi:hypothetical protein